MTVPTHIIETAGAEFIKGRQDNTFRQAQSLAWIRKAGGLRGKKGGYQFNEVIRYKRSRASVATRGMTHEYTPKWEDKKTTFTLRRLSNNDSIDMQDEIENAGDNAMVTLAMEKMPGIVDGVISTLLESFFVDGNEAGFEAYFRGLRTFCKADPAIAVVAADRVGIPNSDYNGINTKPGHYNGDWDATPVANIVFNKAWPFGSGDEQFDFYSPIPFNDVSDAYGHTVDTWRGGNAFDILDAAEQQVRLRGGEGVAPTMHILGDQKRLDFLALLRDNNQTLLPHTAARELGFPETLTYNGGVVTGDFYCPGNMHYSINPNHIKLYYINRVPRGFTTQGDGNLMFGIFERIPGTTYYVYHVYCQGDFWFNPKYVAWSEDLVP